MIRQMVERVARQPQVDRFPPRRSHRGSGSGQQKAADASNFPISTYIALLTGFGWRPWGFDSRPERDFEIPLKVPGITSLPERGIVVQAELSTAGPVYYRAEVYNDEVNALDWEKCAGALVLRNWRPGDRYLPVGRTAAEKIKTLFQESRVPLWERRNWPVIVQSGACEDSIVWARRFGAAGPFAAGTGSKQILFLRETIESNITSGTSIEAGGLIRTSPWFRGRARVW